MQQYVVVKCLRDRRKYRLSLPAAIGSSWPSDLILNVEGLDSVAKVIRSSPDGNGLQVVDLKSGQSQEGEWLVQMGLKAVGPVRSHCQPWRRLLNEAEAAVRPLVASLRRVARNRTFVVGSVAAVSLAVAGLLLQRVETPGTVPEVRIEVGRMLAGLIRSGPGRVDFADGFELVFDLEEDGDREDLALVWEHRDLDISGELEVVVGDESLLKSRIDIGCIRSFCRQELPLKSEILRAGRNVLRFVHRDPSSSYVIRSMFLERVRDATPEERVRAETWLALAERAYAERAIVATNLAQAANYSRMVVESAGTRRGLEQARTRALVVLENAEKELQALVESMVFRYSREFQLENYAGAVAELEPALRILGDIDHPLREEIEDRIRSAKEMML